MCRGFGIALVLCCSGCHVLLSYGPAPIDAPPGDLGSREAPLPDSSSRDLQPPELRPPDLAAPDLRPADVKPFLVDQCPPATTGGSYQWAHRFGSSPTTYCNNTNQPEEGRAVAVTPTGEVFVAGAASSASFWMGDPIGTTVDGPCGSADAILASYASTKAYRWAKRFTGTGIDEAMAVAVTKTGEVVVAGRFSSASINLGGGTAVNPGGTDVFLASFSSTGSPNWVASLDGSGSIGPLSIAIGPSGAIYLAGGFSGTLTAAGNKLTCVGASDAFVAAFTSGGLPSWAKRFGDTGYDDLRGPAIDPAGNLYLTGTFAGSVDFQVKTLASTGGQDILLVALKPDGSVLDAHGYGGAGSDRGEGIAGDVVGNVYLTGSHESANLSFGGATFTSNGGSDLFVASFTKAGVHRWSHSFGGTGDDKGNAIAAAPDGTVYVTGGVTGNVNLGGGSLAASGMMDPFVASFTSCGAHRWSQAFNAMADPSEGLGIAFGGGGVLVTGHYQGSINFGGGPAGSIGRDLFILKLAP